MNRKVVETNKVYKIRCKGGVKIQDRVGQFLEDLELWKNLKNPANVIEINEDTFNKMSQSLASGRFEIIMEKESGDVKE